MTRKCDYCQKPYARPPSQIGKFCSVECRNAGKFKTNAERKYRRVRRQPDHPLAAPSGYVAEARAVLYEKIGPGPHECHWCGTTIHWMTGRPGNIPGVVIADHLNADAHDDSAVNLVPSCADCNAHRTWRVSDDEDYRVTSQGNRHRGVRRDCEMCGESFVAWNKHDGKRGRFCSRSCARKAPRRRKGSALLG